MEHEAESIRQPETRSRGPAQAPRSAAALEPLHPMLELQQQAGNAAVQQMLRNRVIQAKLAVSHPDDPEEREADHVANRIMRSHAGGFPAAAPCSCSAGGDMCEECKQKQTMISRKSTESSRPEVSGRGIERVLQSPGHPLDSATRSFFEPRFGRDFSRVRVHTGPEAAESARSINAHAYAAGDHLVFSQGQYAPHSTSGDHLLAHELAHVVQREAGNSAPSQTDANASDPKYRVFRSPETDSQAITIPESPLSLDDIIKEAPPGFVDPLLDTAYQSYAVEHATESPDPRTWALRQTSGAPRDQLVKLLGPDYAIGQRNAGARPPVDVSNPLRPANYSNSDFLQDLQTLSPHSALVFDRLGNFLSTPAQGNLMSQGHHDILKGNVAEVLAYGELLNQLNEVRSEPGNEDAQLFLGVMARIKIGKDKFTNLLKFSDGIIASVRDGTLRIHRVAEIKSGEQGGIQAQEQVHRWIEEHSTIGMRVKIPGVDHEFTLREIYGLTTARRLLIAPRGARFVTDKSGHQINAPITRIEMRQDAAQIEYLTRLIAQLTIQRKQAVELALQATTNVLMPARLRSATELQDPKTVQRLLDENDGLALIGGVLHRVSISGNAISISVIAASPISVPLSLPPAGGSSASSSLPQLAPPKPAASVFEPAADSNAAPVPAGLLPAGTVGLTEGPEQTSVAEDQAEPSPFSLQAEDGISIMNTSELAPTTSAQTDMDAPPIASEGMPSTDDPMVVFWGFPGSRLVPGENALFVRGVYITNENGSWVAVKKETRQPIAGVSEAGIWYGVVSEGNVLPLNAEGEIIEGADPIPFENINEDFEYSPGGNEFSPGQKALSGGGPAGPSTTNQVVAGGVGLLIVAEQLLGSMAMVLNVQRKNIALGDAQVSFWLKMGASFSYGLWDQDNRKPIDPLNDPDTAVIYGSASYRYIVDVDIDSVRRSLPTKIHNYEEFLAFLDLAVTLETIVIDPQMPRRPTREERSKKRSYTIWVGEGDTRHSYDITDLINSIQQKTLAQLDLTMRARLSGAPAAQREGIFRLKKGSDTPIYRSLNGVPILSGQQVLGPDPWVREVGKPVDWGFWSWAKTGRRTSERVLVESVNADAERSSKWSVYVITKSIEDTFSEVSDSDRPIMGRTPKDGPLQSFTAGPGSGKEKPDGTNRFGTTNYYSYRPDEDTRWTLAFGELDQFWVNTDDLVPVAGDEVTTYAQVASFADEEEKSSRSQDDP